MRVSLLRPLTLALAASGLVAYAACGRDDGPGNGGENVTAGDTADVGGTLFFTVPTTPGNLLPPFVGTIQGKQVTDLVYERLVEIGPELNTIGTEGFAPRLAHRWSWSADSLQLTFHLDSAARWHDGQPVVAEDVRRTFEIVMDPATGAYDRIYLQQIDSVTTPDRHAVTVWFKKRYPEQFFDAGGRLSILPSHLLRGVTGAELRSHPLASAPVGSGRFRFARADPSLVELVADSGNHLGRPKLDRVVIVVVSDPSTATTQLFAGETDLFEALRIENVQEAERGTNVVVKVAPSTAYTFLAFNYRDPAAPGRPHPILSELAVRRAIAMAVDREALVQTVMDTLGLVGAGPFPRALPVADTALPLARHSPQAAAALLDSLGWRDRDGDGVRERDGRPLALSLIVPTSSALRRRLAVILQQQLAQAGIRLDIRASEFQTFVAQQQQGRFDVTLGSWILTDGSPSGLRNTWGTDGMQNLGGYSNPAFDAQVDSGNAAFDHATRREHFRRAFQIIVQDQPALWLYEPRNVIGINSRFRTPPLRATSWWLDLHEWWVPEDQRSDRDRMGLGAVAQR